MEESKFLTKYNKDDLQESVETMYYKTLRKIREHISKKSSNLEKEIYTNLLDVDFMEQFLEHVMKILSQVKVKSVKEHTKNCLVRSSFDLVFRYMFDINYIAISLDEGDECHNFMDLQFKVFRDCNWILS